MTYQEPRRVHRSSRPGRWPHCPDPSLVCPALWLTRPTGSAAVPHATRRSSRPSRCARSSHPDGHLVPRAGRLASLLPPPHPAARLSRPPVLPPRPPAVPPRYLAWPPSGRAAPVANRPAPPHPALLLCAALPPPFSRRPPRAALLSYSLPVRTDTAARLPPPAFSCVLLRSAALTTCLSIPTRDKATSINPSSNRSNPTSNPEGISQWQPHRQRQRPKSHPRVIAKRPARHAEGIPKRP